MLDEDEFVPAVELAGELEHVRKWPAEHWHLAFQGQLRTVSDADAGCSSAASAPAPRGGVIHERHYTLEEASELLPRVVELIAQMRTARDQLGDREAREALSEAGPTNGGGAPGRTVSEAFVQPATPSPSSRSSRWCCATSTAACWTSPRCATAARSTCAGRTARTPSASGTSRRPVRGPAAARRWLSSRAHLPRRPRPEPGAARRRRGAVLLILSALGSFSFVEAALVLLAVGVLALLMARAEGMRFHLPFGDGSVIAGAGIWAGALIVAGLLDRGVGQNVFAIAGAAACSLRRASGEAPGRRRARGRTEAPRRSGGAARPAPGAAAEVDAPPSRCPRPSSSPTETQRGAAASRAGRPGRRASVTPTRRLRSEARPP